MRLWEQNLPLIGEILNLSELEMKRIAKPPDRLIQIVRNPEAPTELPEKFLDNEWVQMMQERLEQLKGLAEAGARAQAAAPSVHLNTCPRCSSTITVGQKFCTTCGNAIVTQPTSTQPQYSTPPQPQPTPPQSQRVPSAPPPIARTCGRCGATVRPGKRFCTSCGAKIQEAAPPPYVVPTQQPPSVPAPPPPPLQYGQPTQLPQPRTVTAQGQLCPKCGTQLKPGHRFCVRCGAPIS